MALMFEAMGEDCVKEWTDWGIIERAVRYLGYEVVHHDRTMEKRVFERAKACPTRAFISACPKVGICFYTSHDSAFSRSEKTNEAIESLYRIHLLKKIVVTTRSCRAS
jgi:hypothetical protein